MARRRQLAAAPPNRDWPNPHPAQDPRPESLRAEEIIFKLRRREGIALSQYFGRSMAFVEAGKKLLRIPLLRRLTPGG
jgi:hypothetical protein